MEKISRQLQFGAYYSSRISDQGCVGKVSPSLNPVVVQQWSAGPWEGTVMEESKGFFLCFFVVVAF